MKKQKIHSVDRRYCIVPYVHNDAQYAANYEACPADRDGESVQEISDHK